MQSRRDHVQAYQFATNRLASALVTGSPGRGQTPFRRAGIGLVAGAIIAVLLCGGAVIYGLIDPASAATTWRQQGALVVDEQTGTRFIYVDGTLHPTANYTSAMLLAGHDATVHDVPHKAMASVPVGATVGIQGAPETLPTTLLPGSWAVCLAPGAAGGAGLDLAPGRHGTGSTAGRLILVAAPTGIQYVLWNNTKYPVAERSALVAFGLGNQQAIAAPPGWLAGLLTGAPLAAPVIQQVGRAGPPIAGQGTPIGTVFEAAAAGANQFYVELADGLAPISRTGAALLVATGRVGAVRHVNPAVISSARASADRSLLGGLPDLLGGTAYQPAGAALCLRQSSPGGISGTTVVTDSAGAAGVVVPGGTGMIVQPPPPRTGFATEPVYLIADTGIKYELADDNATAALGYGGVTPEVMPAAILSLIPTGPALSITAAEQAVTP